MSGDRGYVPRNHAMSAVRHNDGSSLDDDEVRTEPPIPREPRKVVVRNRTSHAGIEVSSIPLEEGLLREVVTWTSDVLCLGLNCCRSHPLAGEGGVNRKEASEDGVASKEEFSCGSALPSACSLQSSSPQV